MNSLFVVEIAGTWNYRDAVKVLVKLVSPKLRSKTVVKFRSNRVLEDEGKLNAGNVYASKRGMSLLTVGPVWHVYKLSMSYLDH